MNGLKIRDQDWLLMKEHVDAEYPWEACGLLGAADGFVEKVVPVENISASRRRFQMHPAQQVKALFDLEASGLSLAAIYHSHPVGAHEPSARDLVEWHYSEAYSLIWSKVAGEWICNAYKLKDPDFEVVELHIVPG